MSVVDIRAVEFNHTAKFLEKRVTHGFNTQHLNHLNQVVTRRTREVNIRMRHYLQQVDAFGVQHPLGLLFEQACLGVDGVGLCFANENLLNVWDTSKRQVGKHLRL